MPLDIYNKVAEGQYVAYSTNGDQTKPVTTVHHSRNGDVCEKKLYIKSDDSHTYTDITIRPISKSTDDDIGLADNPGTTGWGVKIMEDPGHVPTETDWAAIDYGAVIDFTSTISASTTVIPFWFRIESPRGIRVQNKTNIALQLLYTDTP